MSCFQESAESKEWEKEREKEEERKNSGWLHQRRVIEIAVIRLFIAESRRPPAAAVASLSRRAIRRDPVVARRWKIYFILHVLFNEYNAITHRFIVRYAKSLSFFFCVNWNLSDFQSTFQQWWHCTSSNLFYDINRSTTPRYRYDIYELLWKDISFSFLFFLTLMNYAFVFLNYFFIYNF